MKKIAFALSAVTLLASPAKAQNMFGSILEAVEEAASLRSTPQQARPNQRRSGVDEFLNPDLSTEARIEGDKVCYGYLRIGASRQTEICIPQQNFADTIPAASDMSASMFAGNTLATDADQMSRCYIRRGEDPGINRETLDDPAIAQQLVLTCPSRREGGGTYRLTLTFNRQYYLPLRLSDAVCGPDRAVLGSEFDSYVRSSLGDPGQVETDNGSAKGYYWLNTSTTMTLTPDSRGRQTACDAPTSTQKNWLGKIMLNNAVGEPWVAYLRTAAQQQRDSAFTRF